MLVLGPLAVAALLLFSADLVGLQSREVGLFCLLELEVEAQDGAAVVLVASYHQELYLWEGSFLDPSRLQSEEGSWAWAFHLDSLLVPWLARLSWGQADLCRVW